tara:strand:- start:491 stop:1384 length:894 start_codon:yes stop_codon:yes gene_type:complete
MNNSILTIESAFYNKKDVTSIVEELIFDNTLYFIADNSVFGDPEPYKPKKLILTYRLNSKKKVLEAKENEYVKINFIPTNRLGVWYTNNCKTKPKIINRSLNQLYNVSKFNRATILTSVWEEIVGNPFKSYTSAFREGSHICITLQILQLLYAATQLHNFKYVSFLEHDVLYPSDYFNYPDFEKGRILTNMNYIQLSKKGWQKNNKSDQPLHEMTMHISDAIENFEDNLKKGLQQEYFLLENQNLKRETWACENPAAHIFHGSHLTSHYDIYSKEYEIANYYWGHKDLYSDLLEITQ